MTYFKVIFLVIVLFLLTSLLCWFAIFALRFGPLFSGAFFLIGILSVILLVDVIESWLTL